MKKNLAALHRMVGERVESVYGFAIFPEEETQGEVADVSIHFTNGSTFRLGCEGDGRVYVSIIEEESADGPGFTTVGRDLRISGPLRQFCCGRSWLNASIGGRNLKLTNFDDQLDIELDGVDISSQLSTRSLPSKARQRTE